MRNLNINRRNLLSLSNIGITLCTLCSIGTGILAYNNSKPKIMELDYPIRGCDISSHQVYINWDEVKNNYDFIILKATSGLEEDSNFLDNYNNASKKYLDIGVYSFNALSSNNTDSFDDFKEKTNIRIDKLLEVLEDKNIKYPVYLDIEFSKTPINEALPKEYANYLLDTFSNKMKDNNYTPGIYTNKSTYDYLKDTVDNFNDLEVWVAGGDNYNNVTTLNDTDSNNKYYSDEIRMVQNYQYVVNGGAGDALGHLDVDYSYKDYYDRDIDYKNISIAATSIAASGLILKNKKKQIY